MKDLIREPESPLGGFLRGAGATLLGLGLPVTLSMLFLDTPWTARLSGFAWGLGACLVMAVLAGTGVAAWRVIQRAAYRRFLEGPAG